ncbi:MAG TPA: DUF4233 domain-containing protein [Asanoa sp.]|nr:DUF4233 domain-containing protein [Asanoa sp.]
MTIPDGAQAPADQPAADGAAGASAQTTRAGAADPAGASAANASPAAANADPAGADEVPPGYRRSGLRNPAAAVRGMGAAALGLQGVVLLLAIQPIRVLGDGVGAGAVWAAVGLAVVCFVLCGMMRRPWVWTAGSVVQGLLVVSGLLHWTLFALGVIFTLVWLYVLYVRRSILR